VDDRYGQNFLNALIEDTPEGFMAPINTRLVDLRVSGMPDQTTARMAVHEYTARKLLGWMKTSSMGVGFQLEVVEMLAELMYWAYQRNDALNSIPSMDRLVQIYKERGGLEFNLRSWAVHLVGESFADTLGPEADAVEMNLTDFDPPILVTIQRVGNKTPIDVIADQKAHIDALTAENDRLKEELGRKPPVQPNSTDLSHLSRTQAIEKLMTVTGARAHAERNTDGMTDATIAMMGVQDPAAIRFREREKGLWSELGAEIDKLLFTDAMMSDITDTEFRQMLAFFDSPLGKRWIDMRLESHKRSMLLSTTFAKRIGSDFVQLMSVRLHQMVMMMIHQIAPQMAFEDALNVARDVMIKNPLFPAQQESVEIAKVMANQLYDNGQAFAQEQREKVKPRTWLDRLLRRNKPEADPVLFTSEGTKLAERFQDPDPT
jgi:hypothetical protein